MFNKLSKIKYTYILTALFLAIMIVVFVNLRSQLLTRDQRLDTKESGRALLYPGAPATQLLTSEEDGLNIIMIALGKVNLESGENIKLQLSDPSCSQVFAESQINKDTSADFDQYAFKFPELQNSKDKQYCLKVLFTGIYKKKISLPFVFLTQNPIYQAGAFSNGEIADHTTGAGIFSIKPIYGHLILGNEITRLDQRMSQYKPWFFKGGYPISLLATFVLTSVMLVALLLVII